MADQFDLVVLGGGTGGYSAALRAAELGMSVALVERGKVGGTCLHQGCIPTKALLHAAEVYDSARDGERFGIKAADVTYDWDGVQTYKGGVVDRMYKGLQGLLKHRKVEVISSTGELHSPTTISAGGRELSAKNIVVATGSKPKMIPGLEPGERIITSDEALVLDRVPKSAIVLGAGSVGVEFASVWASFGAEVTVVEMLPGLVPLEDADLGKELMRAFKKRKIRALVGAKLEEAQAGEKSVTATVTVDGKSETLEAELLLVAVGRGPVIEGAGLDAAGVKTDRGFVTVTGACETSQSGDYPGPH